MTGTFGGSGSGTLGNLDSGMSGIVGGVTNEYVFHC